MIEQLLELLDEMEAKEAHKKIAHLARLQVDALLVEGFSKDEAVQFVIKNGIGFKS